MLVERHGRVFGRDDPHADAGSRAVAGQAPVDSFPSAAGTTAAAGSWCRSTARRTTSSKAGRRAAPCWSLSMTPPAPSRRHASWRWKRTAAHLDVVGEYIGPARLARRPSTATGTASFGSPPPNPAKSSLTQFRAALAELGVKASAPARRRPKGRVERAAGCLDRLVKLHTLGRRRHWDEGNAFDPSSWLITTARFAQSPGEREDAHAPARPPECLRGILCLKETHQAVPAALSIPSAMVAHSSRQGLGERRLVGPGRSVATLNGILEIRHNGGYLPTRCWRLGPRPRLSMPRSFRPARPRQACSQPSLAPTVFPAAAAAHVMARQILLGHDAHQPDISVWRECGHFLLGIDNEFCLEGPCFPGRWKRSRQALQVQRLVRRCTTRKTFPLRRQGFGGLQGNWAKPRQTAVKQDLRTRAARTADRGNASTVTPAWGGYESKAGGAVGDAGWHPEGMVNVTETLADRSFPINGLYTTMRMGNDAWFPMPANELSLNLAPKRCRKRTMPHTQIQRVTARFVNACRQ